MEKTYSFGIEIYFNRYGDGDNSVFISRPGYGGYEAYFKTEKELKQVLAEFIHDEVVFPPQEKGDQ